VVARYHRHTGNTSTKDTLEELFNSRKVCAVYDLPAHVDALVQNLRNTGFSFTSKELIYNNTLFPLYRHFVSTDKANKVYGDLRGQNGGSVHNQLGLMACSVHRLSYFKFCPVCNEEHIRQTRELYFNRLHQLSTVHFCPMHEIPLRTSAVPVKQYNRHQFIYPDLDLMRLGVVDTYFYSDREVLIKIAKIYKELIEYRFDLSGMDFRAMYLSLLDDIGFIKGNNSVAISKLLPEFRHYFGESLLTTMYSADIDSWLPAITRKHRKTFHPIRHILMILFLSVILQFN
jgi:hypothetical protein